MKILLISLTILFSQLATAAYADCIYNGWKYPEGSQVDGYICQPDGTWKKAS